MRHFLLSILALMSASLVANAVISDDDKAPIFDADDGSITDPNPGHVFDESKNDDETAMFVRDYIQSNYIARSIPSPLDADYYLDLFKDNKLIPLVYNEAEGCYMCDVPVLDSEWKIYMPKNILKPQIIAVTSISTVQASSMHPKDVGVAHII